MKEVFISELYKQHKLSATAKSVCYNGGIKTAEDLISYYYTYGTFKGIRLCGEKTNRELVALSEELIEDLSIDPESLQARDGIAYEQLNEDKRIIVDLFVESATLDLSRRSYNLLRNLLSNNSTLKNLQKSGILLPHFRFSALYNVGIYTSSELGNYRDRIVEFINRIIPVKDDVELLRIRNDIILKRHFTAGEVPDYILTSGSVFTICNYLLENDLIFREDRSKILRHTTHVFNNTDFKTLESLAREFGLTRERIRQMRSECINQLRAKLSSLRKIDDDLAKNYGLTTDNPLLVIDDKKAQKINEAADTNFSKQFITYLLYICFSDQFQLVGDAVGSLIAKRNKSRIKHNWRNLYLINQKNTGGINFNLLIEDIEKRLSCPIEATYELNVKSYISRVLGVHDPEHIDDISSICKELIRAEFDINVDIGENIVFEENVKLNLATIAERILDKIGRPAHVNEVMSELKAMYPRVIATSGSVSGACHQSPAIIFFGRTSTYGLKRWEHERDNIKGGTIRDIVVEYLEKREEPVHIHELTLEVNKYRSTNARNVLTNLKLDRFGRFDFYNPTFVGLKSKRYQNIEKYEKLPVTLGKRLQESVQKGGYSTRKEVTDHLQVKYNLTEKEASHIIDHLKLNF